MKYLKRFANAQEAATILANWPFNTVSSIQGIQGASINLGVSPEPVIDYTIPFYIEDVSGSDNTVQIQKSNNSIPTITIVKSTDGTTWETMGTTSTTAITATIPANGKLYLRCNTTAWGTSNFYTTINTTGNCNVGGNIMSLLYGSNFTGDETTFPSNRYGALNRLLYNNTHLIDASNLLLPATTLAPHCYAGMFISCTSLTSVPVLPATTLAECCYQGMFHSCTSLTNAPVLPAITLTDGCYAYMFYGCTNLNYIKCLATNISASNCTSDWTTGVASSGTFVKDQNMSSWTTGKNGIPSGWTAQDAA